MSAGLAFAAFGGLVIFGLIGIYVGGKLGRRSRPGRKLDEALGEMIRNAHVSAAEMEAMEESMRRTLGKVKTAPELMQALKESVEAARSKRKAEGEGAATSEKGEPEQRQTGNQPG